MPKSREALPSKTRMMGSVAITAVAAGAVLLACSSSSSGSAAPEDGSAGASSGSSSGSGTSSGSSGGTSSGSSGTSDADTCPNPGMPTPGPADMHCATAAPDGGALVQPVDMTSCCNQATPPAACLVDAGSGGCPYGATMWGMEGDDDDCKYHVTWTSGAFCENAAGSIQVPVTVHVVNKTDGSPMASDSTTEVRAEVFTTTPGDASSPTYCDDNSNNYEPGSEFHLTQSSTMPGYWSGFINFDMPGQWTIRFHFHEECADVLPDSPHGHAAFYITLN